MSRELSFRGNFLMKVLLELVWLGVLLLFFHTIFRNTRQIEGWNEQQYLFFLGCYYALEGLIETLFLENSSNVPAFVYRYWPGSPWLTHSC
ncbi:MAG: ABC-2 family transporter protein [Planctomycetota bacterium]|nr:ABC-2 family transporter protein [Planctomycetota bacterium]